jgi:hypothetical protein
METVFVLVVLYGVVKLTRWAWQRWGAMLRSAVKAVRK